MPPRKNFLSEAQLEDIQERSISFPLYFSKERAPEKILTSLYVTDVGPMNVMNVPEIIIVEKMNPDGMITVVTYVATDICKANEKYFEETPRDEAMEN